MLSEIQPYHKRGYLCIDDIVKSVADYFGKEHMYLHAKGLNFTYSPKIVEGEGVLSKLRTSCNYPTYLKNFTKELNYLKDFIGLDVEYVTDLTKEELLSHIRRNLKESNPVAIISSTYYIPWYEQYYNKVNKLHTFLVTDINDKTMSCVDGFLTQDLIKLELENLEDYRGILIFRAVKPKKELNLHNVLAQMIQELEKNHKLENSDSIRIFAKDVYNITFLESEKERYSDLDYSDFMIGLKFMEYGRKNLGDLFYYLSNIFTAYSKSLLDIQSKIDSISEQWKMVVVFIVKGYYSDQTAYYAKRASEQLLDIAKAEEEVTKLIVSLKVKTEEKNEKSNKRKEEK
ncbi:hypothetical protein [Lacrimispora algidixylanolytica]|uniref:Butirosin biosynthesis protein H N-terminal domain-containing protein n=1 Tax=Lacrimispora algidixylanolytica TaxID=94868 RepID=A0A419SYJ7_9FIRM|nr:hypothetical protein [Lacrimispora algidixylanolytica]RKD30239.1 hypothetical protein BET01_06495 [Lacrimispora algidixylanolytica]